VVTAVREWTWGVRLAVVGVLLAMPTIVWPAWQLTFPGQPEFELSVWTWGRLEIRPGGPGGADSPELRMAAVPLVVHVLILFLASAATGVGMVRRGRHSQKLGLAGTAAGFVLVAKGVTERTAEAAHWGPGDGPSAPEVTTLPAGLGENAALVVLTGALVLLLGRSAVRVATPLWRQLSVRARADRDAEDAVGGGTGLGAGGIIVHGVRPVDSTAPHVSSPDEGVPFSDLSPDDDRFWPPKQA